MSRRFDKLSLKSLAIGGCLVLAGLVLSGCSSREERAEAYYQKGMSYIQAKDYVKARVELRNALQIKNNMARGWRALAQIDEQEKNWKGVAGDLRRIVEIDPKDLDARLKLGRLFLLGGSFDDALKAANAASDLDPKNTSALALKAAVLFKLKDADGAIRTAQEAIDLDPGNAEASVVLAAAQFMQGNSAGALKALDKVRAGNETDFGVVFLKINIFNKLGDFGQVETLLKALVEQHPKEPAFRAQLVRFYVAHNRQDDAIKELQAVVAADPSDNNAELEVVRLLGALKGPDAARAELATRIGAGGSAFPFQMELAKLDYLQGKFDDSMNLLQQLIKDSKSRDDVMTARIALAELYMAKNNMAALEPLVTDILKADNRNTKGLMLRATIHLDRGEVDAAIADLRSALNDQPQSPELLANLALAYERGGSIELADKAFLDATKASNYAPAVGLNYIAFLRRRGLNQQADTVLTDLSSRNPNSVPVLTALAQVKLAQQDWAGAHTLAEAIRRLDEKSTVASQINGAAYSGEKKFDDSLTSLKNVYEANPDAPQPLAAMVRVYLQAKQTDRAEAFIDEALKANPSNAEALVLKGSLQLAKGDQTQAVSEYQAAIKEQPKNAIGYKALSDLYTRQKRYDDAIKVLRAGLEADSQNFTLQLTLAGIQEIKGDYEAAISEYETILKNQPGSMIVANNLASLLADHRDDKASLERANSIAALLRRSDIPQFKDTLGWIAYRRDDFSAALPLLEGAGTAMPNNALVHYHLGLTYLAAGQEANASEQLKKAKELAPNDEALRTKIDAALKSAAEKTEKNKG
jgi:tetratricopeptide (TPR) repeat protein